MLKWFLYFTSMIFLFSSAGCGRFDVKMEMPGYSLGPVSAENFSDLVQEAIPTTASEIQVVGRATWTGFSGSPGFAATSPYFSGVVALTETDILLLLWNENEDQYEIVKTVSYSELTIIPSKSFKLYFKEPGFSLGQQTYTADLATYLRFMSNRGIVEKSKNEDALLVLKRKVETHVIEETTASSKEDY